MCEKKFKEIKQILAGGSLGLERPTSQPVVRFQSLTTRRGNFGHFNVEIEFKFPG